ncbi:Acyl-CoA dehydrogenase, long-chain specific, mitochondrial precursor [Bacillus subtilis]|uniref:acyl-CoA dehydrogenase family protein n=1 Tax=Bacillus subtilis TaxID=1423 RepID=UPI00059D5001|nr:acyl-CoA dehydrogenase family protein [Bacillus subtilis]KIN31508.1 Acyl-CoA dehydrogenase, long-chain specific, mitochondrial precursor [Bacillus subtilis]KIN56072.1 Acyl-CoA dehydrogenase, long-chain specific, mitochondrial precursor [Bacillus subtilis]MCR1991741.1 acyl-CoA/acyl-ACP dehydrogenase [Bacillus subtilis]
MNFQLTKEQKEFRDTLRTFFQSKEIKELTNEIKNGPSDYDAREIYKLLGQERMLAPNFPEEYGGMGSSFFEAAILTEEMSYNGIPEALHVLSTLIVGNLILLSAKEEQKRKYLPSIANGDTNVCILYSEPKKGSDLSSLDSHAILEEDGTYLLYGRKVYSMKTHLTDYGLIAVRTSNKGSKYDGLTLFMVPLKNKNVTITPIPSLSDESLYEVVLDGVYVSSSDLIGDLDEGWTIINKALSVERTGLDYLVRAERWFDLVWNRELDENGISNENTLIELTRLGSKLDASKALTYKVIDEFDRLGAVDESLAAISKYYASELACDVVWKGHDLRGIGASLSEGHGYNPLYGSLEAAYRETPGLTLSAGTSEMMLETISKFRLNSSN